jgi:TonB-dependent receptor
MPNDPVTGGSATFVSVAGTNCPLGVCTGAWAQEQSFNNGLPIAGRTYFASVADAVSNTGGVVNPVFGAGNIGSQMLRVWQTEQTSEVTEGRIDGKLEFEDGRFAFGLDFRNVEMTRRTGQGEAVLGDWSASDAGGNSEMVSLLTPFSMTGLFNDYSTTGAAPNAYRGNATELAQWALGFTHPVSGRVYNWNRTNTTTPDGVLAVDPALDNNNKIEEEVQAAYVQFALKGELAGLPTNTLLGVRYEKTEVTSTSSILVPSAVVWTANNDFTIARSSTQQPFQEEAEYSHVLPSLDFDIGLTDTLKGRLSYSTTIARANYGDLYAGPTVNTPTGSVLISPTTRASATALNPGLVPLESNNLDLSLEWYFSDSGYVSMGWWEKRVENFIGTAVANESLYGLTDPTSGPDAQAALAFLNSAQCDAQVTAAGNDPVIGCNADDTALFVATTMLRNAAATGGLAAYDGGSEQVLAMENDASLDLSGTAADPLYQFATQRRVNQEDARIRGWEFGGQYFFGDSGFGVLANYTVVSGDVKFNDVAAPGTQQFALLGLSDTANAVLMFEKFGFTARLAYNWRDKFLAATNQNGSNTNPYYVDEYQQIDFSLGYDINDNLALSLEGINLTGEDIRWFGRSEKQMVRLEDASPRYAIGARYKF